MYRDRSPPYPLWFAFASKEEKGRIIKILELRNNYCIDRTKQIRLTKERFEIKRSAIHWTCDEADKIMVMGQPGLVRYLSNHQYACLWTDQKPQTFFMRKLPASAPKKLERPFVATSAVWLWDTLQAWEGYAISRHSTKRLHGALMNASIFFLQGFLSLTPDNKPLKFFCPGMVYHRRHFMDRQFFDWLKLKMCDSYFHKLFFFRKVWFFRPLK